MKRFVLITLLLLISTIILNSDEKSRWKFKDRIEVHSLGGQHVVRLCDPDGNIVYLADSGGTSVHNYLTMFVLPKSQVGYDCRE